jgi:multidrug efflux pump subunit AcrA (membrane-fusion protein)
MIEPIPIRRNVNGLFAALVAFAVAGCAAQAAPTPKGPPPVSVSTAKVTRGAISTSVAFDGQITPVFQTTLSTAEAGTVASVNVTEGDFVRKGQVLASLDTSQLQASLKASLATVREDDAQLERSTVAAPVNSQQYSSAVSTARQNLATAVNSVRTARAALASDDLTQKADRELLAQEYVSRETYEQARAAYVSAQETLRSNQQAVTAQQAALQTALINTDQRRADQATIAQNQAGLDGARANVELLQAQIAQSSIVAPFDGQVTQRLLDPGAYAINTDQRRARLDFARSSRPSTVRSRSGCSTPAHTPAPAAASSRSRRCRACTWSRAFPTSTCRRSRAAKRSRSQPRACPAARSEGACSTSTPHRHRAH